MSLDRKIRLPQCINKEIEEKLLMVSRVNIGFGKNKFVYLYLYLKRSA